MWRSLLRCVCSLLRPLAAPSSAARGPPFLSELRLVVPIDRVDTDQSKSITQLALPSAYLVVVRSPVAARGWAAASAAPAARA